MSEEVTGPPPTEDANIEEESNWIYGQLRATQSENEMPINKEDITRLLEFMHIQKYDVSTGSLYF